MLGSTATRKQFLEAVKALGATVDFESERNADNLQVDAPAGFTFAENGCHTMVEPFANIGQSWKPEAYATMIKRLSYGLDKCEAENCEYCVGE